MDLYRIENQNAKIGGVCAGIAQYYGFDVTMVRLVAGLLIFTPLPVILVYLVLWAFLPSEKNEFLTTNNDNQILKMSNHKQNGNMVGGLILIILGAIFSFRTFFDINLFQYMKNMWPLFLIGLGVWLIVKEKDNDHLQGPNNTPTTTNY